MVSLSDREVAGSSLDLVVVAFGRCSVLVAFDGIRFSASVGVVFVVVVVSVSKSGARPHTVIWSRSCGWRTVGLRLGNGTPNRLLESTDAATGYIVRWWQVGGPRGLVVG
jgi:hypothetical protein